MACDLPAAGRAYYQCGVKLPFVTDAMADRRTGVDWTDGADKGSLRVSVDSPAPMELEFHLEDFGPEALLHILGTSQLAEEATQDTFLKLWSRARQYLAERGPFLSWLLTIAHRVALDRIRLEARRPLLNDPNIPEAIWQNLPDSDTTTEEARWRSLYFAVQALHPDQRKVIELAYYQGMSQSEIADVLGWPLGTVKTRLRAQWNICVRPGMKSKSKSIIGDVYLLGVIVNDAK